MIVRLQRTFWSELAGACVLAIVATVPILMSTVMDRGFEIPKLSVAEPLAILGFGAALLAGSLSWTKANWPSTKLASCTLLTFLCLAILSTVLSEMPATALFGGYYRREGLIAWCAYGAFFFAVLGWVKNQARLISFLDVLLLASVVPCSYALLQRLNLDFYFTAGQGQSRAFGTLGNANFLGAYLGLLLPITAVRIWQERRKAPECFLWICVILLQGGGLLVTQSRGPLLASILGLLMLSCLAAGRHHARRAFLGALSTLIAVPILIVAINTVPPITRLAQDLPITNRLIYSLNSERGTLTDDASRSTTTRLAIMQAGIDTFASAPLLDKLLGFGPETAYMRYFPHMPAVVMSTEGYAEAKTFDRLHADTLDIGLNFGLLGWLAYCLFFCSVMYGAARALFGLSGSKPLGAFLMVTIGCGAIFSLVTILIGVYSAAVPAFGLGLGFGWFAFFVACSWRAMRNKHPQSILLETKNWGLLSGLTSSLLVFWADAQINIPVLTTRLISFGVAALILYLSTAKERGTQGNSSEPNVAQGVPNWLWGISLSLLAAASSFLPAIAPDAPTPPLETKAWWLGILPILPLLFFTVHTVRIRWHGTLTNQPLNRYVLIIALGCPALFTASRLGAMALIDSTPGKVYIQTLSAISMMAPISILLMTLGHAWIVKPCLPASNDPPHAKAIHFPALILAALVLWVAAQGWRATLADISAAVAQSATSKNQSALGEELIEQAVSIMPYERRYRRQQIFDLLDQAATDIRVLKLDPARYPAVKRNLSIAEDKARENLLRFPRDPWALLALANVLQFRALHLLRPFDPAMGERAAKEARDVFARAHEMFPSQPLLLRNWAQLEFDEGRYRETSHLLDLMENLIPGEVEAYSERIALSLQLGDFATVAVTLDRASRALDPKSLAQLKSVVSTQQK